MKVGSSPSGDRSAGQATARGQPIGRLSPPTAARIGRIVTELENPSRKLMATKATKAPVAPPDGPNHVGWRGGRTT